MRFHHAVDVLIKAQEAVSCQSQIDDIQDAIDNLYANMSKVITRQTRPLIEKQWTFKQFGSKENCAVRRASNSMRATLMPDLFAGCGCGQQFDITRVGDQSQNRIQPNHERSHPKIDTIDDDDLPF